MARHGLMARVLLLEGVANVLLSIILLRYMGLIGVAWGTAIPLFITSVLFLPFHVCKQLHLNVGRYALYSHASPLLPNIPLVAALIFMNNRWPASDYFTLGAECLVGMAVYFAAARWFLVFANKTQSFATRQPAVASQ
jgi:hypothetical protein